MAITVQDPQDQELLSHLQCACGNFNDFYLDWLGDLHQPMYQNRAGERGDYGSHENEGEEVLIEYTITCAQCRQRVAERSVTISVGPWVRTAGMVPFANH